MGMARGYLFKFYDLRPNFGTGEARHLKFGIQLEMLSIIQKIINHPMLVMVA